MDAEEINTPGKNIKIPKKTPLNINVEYKLLNIIPIPSPFKNTLTKLDNNPKNVKDDKKSKNIVKISHDIIVNNNDKLLKFITLCEKIFKSNSNGDSKQPNTIPQ